MNWQKRKEILVGLVQLANKMKFSNNYIKKFTPQMNLKEISVEGQTKIISAKIIVIGLGGIGTPFLTYICRAGISNIGVVDHDKVTLSNLHRQIMFYSTDLNKKKTTSVKSKIKQIDKNIKVKMFNKKISKNNIKNIIKKYDYVIDGTDNFETKLLINDECKKQKKHLFIGAVSQLEGHIFYFDFKKNYSCLRCFMPSKPKLSIRCQDEGILGTVTGVVGTLIANEILKVITNNKSQLLNNILIINFEKLTFRQAKINRRLTCKHGK